MLYSGSQMDIDHGKSSQMGLEYPQLTKGIPPIQIGFPLSSKQSISG